MRTFDERVSKGELVFFYLCSYICAFHLSLGYLATQLGLLLWAYFSVVLTDPGSVPSNWKPAVDEEIAETAPLTGTEFSGNILNLQQPGPLTDTGSPKIRYCRKCNQLKPPRCHHCSVCGRCVLKMDHHCVWVVNCVGALNYKFFLLFLFYTFLETSLVTLSLFPHFIAFFKDVEIPGTPGTLATTFLAFVLNLAFALSVMGFLIMHVSLVMKNTTTIEAYEKKTTPNWEYDLGRKKNFEQVRSSFACISTFIGTFARSSHLTCPSHSVQSAHFARLVCRHVYSAWCLHNASHIPCGFLYPLVSINTEKHKLQSINQNCSYSAVLSLVGLHLPIDLDDVFGTDKKYWFIPAYSEEDLRRMPALQGFEYPTKSYLDTH
ncbi:hypothetical protein ZIOFF_074610 [Zingiber officinale]|uniref:S-acyltransferase n=1 Tax=Zingiber officinale TaxID=94328 RepID=A0A8J5E969_ZINOF|nr:hypothetical protein ZIOFF_074610 [Zingiber officinale]